jgi:hypothetical protein
VTGLADRIVALHDALEEAQLPHAIGGAIALGYCVLEARATQDVDLNVFVPPQRARDVFAALPQGVSFSGRDLEAGERDGQVRLRWERTPIDLFFSVLPFHDYVARSVRHVPFGERTIPVIGCTALAVFKALFDRTRDWADIEAMVEARALDLDETAALVAELGGADSPAAHKLAALRP